MTERVRPPLCVATIIAGVVAALIGSLAFAAVEAEAKSKCRLFKHRGKVESTIFQTDLAYLNIRKRACYNGKRITAVSKKLKVEPTFTDSNVNIEWDKLASAPTHRYRRWHGRRKGAHYSRVSGIFKASAGPVSSNATVEVSLTVYGNGKTRKRSKDADGPFH